MKKIIILLNCVLFSFMLFGCNNKEESEPMVEPTLENVPTEEVTKEEVTPTIKTPEPTIVETSEPTVNLLDTVWKDEYCDKENNVTIDNIKNSKLFYNGEYVSLDTQVSKRKDMKYEFYTDDALRFVNSPDQYIVTIPSGEVNIDYSIGAYRLQFEFNDSVLTVSHETSNPYGGNKNGWLIYLNEWVNRYINNPKFLRDNNLEYTRDPNTSILFLEGYEVIRYCIYIKDSEGIDKPYYDIAIVRKVKSYINFHLFVMKSETNQSLVFDKIIESFKTIDGFGYPSNYINQYESVPNPNWNNETLNYFNKLNAANTLEFGFFSYSLPDDNNLDNVNAVYQKVITENNRLYNLTNYNQEICATYTHLGWGNSPSYFPTTLAKKLAGGNGFNGLPVLQFTLQYTTNNNDVNIHNYQNNYTPMFDILRGKYDDYFVKLAQDIKDYGAPVLFRLNNEMNTDWTSYCGMMTLLDPDIFQETWIRLYEIFEQEGVDNCIWIFNPIAVSCPYSSWGEDLCYMPGVEYVQALGITRYEMLNNRENYTSFKDGYTLLYEKNKNYWMNYPWIVSEFGCAAGGAISEAGELTELYRNKDIQAVWVKEMFECLADKENNEFCSKISAMVWFNCNDYKDGLIMNSLHLDSSLEETFEELKEGLAKIG